MKNKTRIRRVCFLAIVATLTGLAENARAELRVSKPAGGTLTAGSSYQVMWQSNAPRQDVELTLMQRDRAIGSAVRLRGQRQRDSWAAAWRVPESVAEGLYHIRLVNPIAREQAVSRLFNVRVDRTAPGGGAAGGITLTGFPTTGQTLHATQQLRLTWRASDTSLRYQMRLMRHSRHVNHLTGNEGASGSFTWIVGRNYAPDEPAPEAGNGYQLVVESMDGRVRQVSNAFTIRWPVIQLQEPANAARAGTIRGDRPNTVRWTGSHLEGDVVVSLYKRTNLHRSGAWIELGRGGASGSLTASWMEEYETRRNNWESGTAKIVIRSARAPGIFMQTEEFTTTNTSMPSER